MDTPATKQDVLDIITTSLSAVKDDLMQVLDIMMTRIDAQFHDSERRLVKLQKDVNVITDQIDGIYKSVEISEDERAVIAYQLTKLHMWVEKAGGRIGLKFDD